MVKLTKCKRDAKLMHNIHIAILDEYLNSNWKETTDKGLLAHNHWLYLLFSDNWFDELWNIPNK